MASTSDFKNGVILNHKKGLWKIVEFMHVKPGKGPAFVRTKLKNVKTGQVVEETFRAGEKIEIIRIEARDYTYSYFDGEFYVFMDNETFEQISLTNTQVEDVLDFLIENTTTTIAFNGDEPIEVRIPQHMNLKIVETDPGEKGNTAQGGTKPAKLETGVVIQVPLFIQEGESVRVDTKDCRYIERVKS
ncbi:MAG: elongation factor P [Candidatus Marinimicrobia bacterium]|nr:elongation factor P [Candidatus Neomarinimicrobiota bacterium]MBL7023046.1 elongation factor P [Candidatus Neomarinimicrobiota bacterium]MBL7110147.1 elongation factor P [Candidatus Neomarinimicrobiota bacterium]